MRAAEDAAPATLRVAVLDFDGSFDKNGSGGELADAVRARLAGERGVVVLEREQILRLLEEQKVALGALVGPREAIQVGRLVSAQLMIAGRVSSRGGSTRAVVRVISTETSRLAAVSVDAPAEKPFTAFADEVAAAVAARVKEFGPTLIATDAPPDAIAPYVEKLRGRKLPVAYVKIPEQHVGRAVPDPAAETEILLALQRAGVPVLDPASDKAEEEAELLVTGEGLSSFGTRTGELITCVARLEWKVRRRGSGRLDLVGHETARRADLAEPIAAKLALQDAGQAAAVKILEHLDRTAPAARP